MVLLCFWQLLDIFDLEYLGAMIIVGSLSNDGGNDHKENIIWK